jgi:hypothetical protein
MMIADCVRFAANWLSSTAADVASEVLRARARIYTSTRCLTRRQAEIYRHLRSGRIHACVR